MIRIILLWLLATPCLAQAVVPREEQGFTLRHEHDSLYWLCDWRLPYPVYQFQTGDVDGDGQADAMVGVIKATRFYPEKARRLFIFKRVKDKARPLWLGSKLGGILEDFRFKSAYKPTLDKMKKRMNEIDWQETIATQWVNSLKTIAGADKDKRCPYFMGTPEWDLKNLNAILASWAELKHDAILYAKQPMGAECGGGGIPDPVVRGYVEPNVPFWQKSIALLDHIQQVMEQEQMLTEKVKESTIRIREEAEFLLHASEKELSGKMLTDEEYDHIEYIGAQFENISLDMVREPDQSLMGWSDVQGADKNVAVVADVYTANADNNPDKTILYEAVGNADVIYVIVEINGYLYLTRGGVLSYREFTEPIDQQRLTDEEWQKQLEKDPRKGVPTWMQRITIPLEQQPKPDEETFYSSGC